MALGSKQIKTEENYYLKQGNDFGPYCRLDNIFLYMVHIFFLILNGNFLQFILVQTITICLPNILEEWYTRNNLLSHVTGCVTRTTYI